MNISLEKVLVNVVDQYGATYTVDAMCERSNDEPNSFGECIRSINIDEEVIKPSFDFHFYSNKTGKIFKLS